MCWFHWWWFRCRRLRTHQRGPCLHSPRFGRLVSQLGVWLHWLLARWRQGFQRGRRLRWCIWCRKHKIRCSTPLRRKYWLLVAHCPTRHIQFHDRLCLVQSRLCGQIQMPNQWLVGIALRFWLCSRPLMSLDWQVSQTKANQAWRWRFQSSRCCVGCD